MIAGEEVLSEVVVLDVLVLLLFVGFLGAGDTCAVFARAYIPVHISSEMIRQTKNIFNRFIFKTILSGSKKLLGQQYFY